VMITGDSRYGSRSRYLLVQPLPFPGQQFNEPALRDAGGGNQRRHSRGAGRATIGAGEEPRFASQRNLALILPIAGRMSSSIIAGIRCTGVVRVAFFMNAVHRLRSCMWSSLPAS
jgi:hypothetical protein